MDVSEIYDILVNSPVAKNWIAYLERNHYDYGHIGCKIHSVNYHSYIKEQLLGPGERAIYANVKFPGLSSKLAGVVITDFGVRKKDKDYPQVFIKWTDVTDISPSKGLSIRISSQYDYIDLYAGSWEEYEAFQELTRMIYNKILEEKETSKSVFSQINELRISGRKEEAINKALRYRFCEGGVCLYLPIIETMYELGDYQQVVNITNEFESLKNEDKPDYNQIELIKAAAYQQLQDLNEAKNVLVKLSANVSNKDIYNDELLKDRLDREFSNVVKNYKKTYQTIPYQKRKILMVVPEYPCVQVHNVSYFKISDLPELQFPLGHPKNGEFYIGYPNNPIRYIPLKDYEITFLEDKIRELSYLAQCLGAKEISIETFNSFYSEEDNQSQSELNGKASALGGKGSVKAHAFSSNSTIEKLSKKISFKQTFTPQHRPFVPADLIWLDGEDSWKTLIKQRMIAGLDSYEIRIETEKSQMVSSKEMNAIKGEVKMLMGSLKADHNEVDERMFSTQENAVFSVKIKFAPLSELQNGAQGPEVNPKNGDHP